MYLDVLNDNMVGLANISARDMLDHLFSTCGNITAVDLEINFEHMRRAWDPQQPVETLFKQIQDCAEFSAKIFATGHFMSACRRWNEKHHIEKTWTQFKSHFATAHCQHKQMQGESLQLCQSHTDEIPVRLRMGQGI
jgi:Na+/phosphate symporter